MKKNLALYLVALAGLIIVNIIFSIINVRADFTADNRYTLTAASEELADEFNSTVIVDLLLEGDLPSEFVRLKLETLQLLKEFESRNSNFKINLVDPLEGVVETGVIIEELQQLGLTPANVTTEENNRVSQDIVFPWAVVSYKNTSEKVGLLVNRLGSTPEERINNSVQNLEYAFADAFSKLQNTEKKSIAVIKGNGQLDDRYIADLLTSLNSKYAIGKITLDSVNENPAGVLRDLNSFDLALIAKPTMAFSEAEKLVLDQYTINGGKTLWFIDKIAMDLDSLLTNDGEAFATTRNLNLDDYFFRYGLRINPDLVKDLICSQIVLAAGEADATQYNPVPWFYYPMVFPNNSNPLTSNIEAVRYQFASSIDTLPNPYKKTILYSSSPKSYRENVPRIISLDQLRNAPDEKLFSEGNIPMAVLIEGSFSSAFENRVLPFNLADFKAKGDMNKMVVISDGDIVANQLRNGKPLPLGYDKWTNNMFGNKDFIMNTIDYLLGQEGLINIRNKQINIPMLDPGEVEKSRYKWQVVHIGVPLLVLTVFGLFYRWVRRRKYTT